MNRKRLSIALRFIAFVFLCGSTWLASIAEEIHDSITYNLILFVLYFTIVSMLFVVSFIVNELAELKRENEGYKRTLYRCNHKKYVHADGDDELFILREDVPEIIECLYDIQKASEEEYR